MKWLVTSTVAIGVLIIAGFFFFSPNEAAETVDHPEIDGQPMMGDENAEVSIIEFGDYKCPACKVWDETVFHDLTEDYIEPGEANFAFINTPFHGEESLLAGLASESVWHHQPEAFWEYHEAIYAAQPDAAGHDDEWVTVDELLRIAEEDVDADIDVDQLAADIVEQNFEEEVTQDIALVQQYDIELTPTIMINGTVIEDPFDYEKIVETIEEEL